MIYDHLANLSDYNKRNKSNVFIVMEHLPQEMQNDRKELMAIFKKTKLEEPFSKRVWFTDRDTGRYCLKVGNVVNKSTFFCG